ncbi:MAG: hypothetical protein BGO31_00225 [Bacteroidetes bacterium 43-16]|uniref:hypothetical protein n=1 Tax=uncultured Dysgonomonas sp. TaxID=206096 RepID=UPI00092B2665|nr:hypothetical protein [uncultured Dysgonomonas sp.]OJV51665.1 MAG: hypothetical protein BGO31_00225 [Bacteroidetes bacterium 43-16]
MPKIQNAIGKRNFEYARDAIGAILFVELDNQATIQDDETIRVNVWVNRISVFDQSEMPAINVRIATLNFSDKYQGCSTGEDRFIIDLSVRDKDESKSLMICQKIAGIIHAILEDSQYKTLGFSPPFNNNSIVSSMQFSDIFPGQDAANISSAVITYDVTLIEETEALNAPQIQQHLTGVLLAETDQGYQYQWIEN